MKCLDFYLSKELQQAIENYTKKWSIYYPTEPAFKNHQSKESKQRAKPSYYGFTSKVVKSKLSAEIPVQKTLFPIESL